MDPSSARDTGLSAMIVVHITSDELMHLMTFIIAFINWAQSWASKERISDGSLHFGFLQVLLKNHPHLQISKCEVRKL